MRYGEVHTRDLKARQGKGKITPVGGILQYLNTSRYYLIKYPTYLGFHVEDALHALMTHTFERGLLLGQEARCDDPAM